MLKITNKANTGMKCSVTRIEGDEDHESDIDLYISNCKHNYKGHTSISINELKTISKTLNSFLKKYKDRKNTL